jgi:hypothetical protein
VEVKLIYLYIKRRIEPHLQEPLIILVEYAQETLLENGSGKRIGKDHYAVGGIWKGFHLQETNLIETSCK